MNSLRTLRSALLAAPLFVAPLAGASLAFAPLFAVPAYAQTDQAASLLEALSLVSGRMLVAPVLAPKVTRDGDRFHVHIPLPQLTSPPDAAIEVAAIPLESGVWDITDLTFPSTGTLTTAGMAPGVAGKAPVSLRFTIGQQTAHARIDPTLTLPSPYAMAFSDIALHLESAEPPAHLTIGQMTLDGTIAGDGGGRMTTRSHSRADNWHFTASTKTGAPFTVSLRSADLLYGLDGLDRARADRLRDAARAVAATQKATPPVPGQPPSMSPAVREQLQAIIEASGDLLTGLNIEETLQGLHFEAAGGNTGDIGEIRFAVAGEAADDRVAAHVDVGVNDMTLAAVPAQFVQYMPRRISFRTAFSGIEAEALRHFLRDAMAEGANPASRQAAAIALLNEPGAHAGIESMSVESGPLLIQGSARVRALPDGTAAFDIHLTAHGLDAMLALIQSDPKAQQIIPMLFLAKGFGKPEGDNMVWDIGFAHGRATVNGVPLGQNAGGESGVRPPASR
jgi:hypothetical protein